ncbi:MAG: hypothetical protein AABY22_06120 [Nanoarchaeota archaeon]
MAKTQEEKDLAKAEKEAAKLAAKEAKEKEEEPEEEKVSKVARVYRNGVLQREYSFADQGKRFKELAAEFAGKHGYEVVVK